MSLFGTQPFGAQQSQGFNNSFGSNSMASSSNGMPMGGNDILQPTVTYSAGSSQVPQKPQPKNLGSNLETGLTSAVENLCKFCHGVLTGFSVILLLCCYSSWIRQTGLCITEVCVFIHSATRAHMHTHTHTHTQHNAHTEI